MLEIDPEDKRRVLEPSPDSFPLSIQLLIITLLVCFTAASAYYLHPEWFTKRYWQSRESLSREGAPDEEFAAVYAKYGVPALSSATASSSEIRPYLATLSKDPCNKHAVFQLTVNLERSIWLRDVAAVLQGYAKSCPIRVVSSIERLNYYTSQETLKPLLKSPRKCLPSNRTLQMRYTCGDAPCRENGVWKTLFKTI